MIFLLPQGEKGKRFIRLQKLPEYAPLLQWAPVACWSVAGAGLLVVAASRMQRSVAAK